MYPDGFGYYAPKVMGKYIHKIYTKKNCYLAMHAGTHMFCIDEKTGEGYWINILWPNDDEIMSNLVKRSRNLLQEHLVSLPEYLKYMEKENKEVSRKFGKVGQLIWKFCK